MKDSHGRHRSNIETKQCASNDGHRGYDIDISDYVAHDEGEGEGRYPKYIGKEMSKNRGRGKGRRYTGAELAPLAFFFC